MTDSAPELLHNLLEARAAAHPDAIAVVCGSESLTYGELNRRADALASSLAGLGVQKADRVGLFLPRSLDVYVAFLGVLKAGATYVPLDPDYPAERVSFILEDCKAKALVTTKALNAKLSGGTQVRLFGEEFTSAERCDRTRLASAAVNPDDVCYIIYTSGTTGQPKGVEITHRSVCHLVRAEAEIFRIQPEDRVFHVSSIAFDASVEEIWLAFFSGARLVVGTAEMIRAGPELSRMIADAGITVLSCVPTLLMILEEDIPSVRLLILGGEASPPGLIKKWWKPNRRIVNTYGPTEATVIATWTDCHADSPITIGRPVRGYTICILDEALRPAPRGEPGELCIGGIGLARGYLNRPELTREKFIQLQQPNGLTERVYRTGDLVRENQAGDLEFLGRIDTQVKIRGFRVELGEIESALMECHGVRQAAVALREDIPGVQRLVAYVVPRTSDGFDAEQLRRIVGRRLPPYMVPANFERLSSLPTLPSGKLDRKNLPAPSTPETASQRKTVDLVTPTERQIVDTWARLFGTPVSIHDDFFLDLGGHSLLAARMVSELRKKPGFESISVLHVYRCPTVKALAASLDHEARDAVMHCSSVPARQHSNTPSLHSPAPLVYQSTNPFTHFCCGLAQAVSLLLILSFFALQWLAPYLTYTILIEEEFGYIEALIGAFASLVLLYPIMVAIPIIVKWLVIGRYKPGNYPLWGAYFFRWWLVTTIETAVPVGYMAGTPLLNLYCRLMGAKIGRAVHLGSDSFAIYDLLTIGDGTSINSDSNLLGYTVENGFLKIGTITIGKKCFVGTRAAVRENTVMEDDATLEDLSLLSCGRTIPAGETWVGSPGGARQVSGRSSSNEVPASRQGANRDASSPPHYHGGDSGRAEVGDAPKSACWRMFFFGVLHACGLLVFPVLVVAALFPGIVVMNELNYLDPGYWYLLLGPLAACSFVFLLCLEIAAIKWLLLGRVRPGTYHLRSWYYLRRWFVGQTMELSLEIIGPIYASVYLTPWYKLLGARLGKGAEISTASFISPDLLEIGDESFIADNVSLGAPRIRDGIMTIGPNRIGKRSFIGNSAILPPGTVIGDSVLIGCLSAPPDNPADCDRFDSAWMGSPPFFLPQRQKIDSFSEQATYDPNWFLRVQRAVIEFVRVIAPSTGFIILLSLLFSGLLLLRDHFSLRQTLFFFPFLYLGCGAAAALFTIAMKWLLVGRYRSGERPLWCNFIWRNELINALHEHLAGPFLVESLTGTPFICWYFRLLGARIGKRVYMETSDFSEFDLARIGDESALNAGSTIQTHLFEDRIMKMSTVEIGSRCKVGTGSLVLYDTRMEDGSALDDLSLLMKGEVLPAGTLWEGIPARKKMN